MFDGYWRDRVERAVDPVGERLHRVGISANQLTVVGVAAASAAAVAIGSGRFPLGLALLVVAAVPDLLDGPVAKAAGPTTRRGAFFDSTADRVTDTILIGGVTWFLIADDRGLQAMVPFAVMGASWLISYQRAKAESLGFDAKGGIMERAERIIVLAVGLAFPSVLVPILYLMLALTMVTAIQRFTKVWRQASAELT
ncbi:MAG: CDP-alcohol phosphatidyltransferase family protein [Acidimicrobiales bacterium]